MSVTEYFQDVHPILAIAVGLYVIYLVQLLVKNMNSFPGPWGLPIVGYGPFLGDRPSLIFHKLAKKYGELYSINLGGNGVVVINNYELYKEVFTKTGDNFTGITPGFSAVMYTLESTVFQNEGTSWKEQRKFLVTCLRDFGVGRLKTEKNIQEEAQIALHVLRDYDGQPIDFINSRLLGCMTFNAVSTLILGRRFDYDDPKLQDFVRNNAEWLLLFSQVLLVDMFPFLRFLPHKLTGLDKMIEYRELCFGFVNEIIKEHEADFNPNDIRDITDLYLKAHLDLKNKGVDPENTFFSRKRISHNLGLLVASNTDDASLTLTWLLKMVAAHPECQQKMQEEIDRVVGRQRLPSWANRNELPFVEAFILEVFRASSHVPMSMPHSNFGECTIKNYTFPKRTLVAGNFYSVHNNSKLWGDPENFRPERFIGDDGKLNKMKDFVLLFGAGNRSCPGESLARMELFIFMTAIIQSFTLTPPPGQEFNLDTVETLQRRLKSCILCAVPRD